MILNGTHDTTLVTLSILVATLASYTALDLAGRVRAASGWACHAWLATAALAMGGGIWSMHFIAMLAFSMPDMAMDYDVALTVVSLVLPVLVTGVGFHLVNRRDAGVTTLALSGLVMGIGIVAMHYTGMAAMRMPADLSYDDTWVAVSVLIAIGASTIALWLAFKNTGLVQKLVAAVSMGLAVSGMHYAAMQGAVFSAHSAVDEAHGHTSLGQSTLALTVAGATFLILFLALVAAMFDRRFALLAEREAQALRTSEERFRTLYRRTPLPLHSVDEDGTIEQVSDAWLDLMGYSREEVVGRRLINFMTEESARRRVQEDAPKLLADGHLNEIPYRMVTKSGDTRDVLLSATVERNAAGEVVSILGGLMDVTDKKRAEDALRQAQKIEAVGQLTGGVAHDFNNLLAVVLGNLELVRKRLPDNPKLIQMVDNAIQAGQRGAALTQRMLAFARRQDLKPEPVDVPNLIRGMADLLQRSVGPRVQIETRFPLDLPLAQVDANQLELALLNLSVNARDALPGGGLITIGAKECTVGSQAGGVAEGRYVVVSVADTGEGMDEATLARAMEPFFTTKGVGRGTGLGLSMVHGLAAQSGGRLTLHSLPGQGTTAEIWLPVASGQPRAAEPPGERVPKPHRTEPITVLVVDDDSLVLANTAALLEDLGHTTVPVGSGQHALEVLHSGLVVDLVVTDYAMPVLTGVELARAIKGQWPNLPILLATGYAQNSTDEEADLVRLRKPFGEGALAQAIAECLQRTEARTKIVAFRTKQG
jgi:PAS domain S-box-containing protein